MKNHHQESINPDLTPLYSTAMFIGAKNSYKIYGLVKSTSNISIFKIFTRRLYYIKISDDILLDNIEEISIENKK
jgi:hypothetical protein